MQLPQSLSASVLGLLALLGTANSAATKSNLVASSYFAGFHANRGFPVSAMPWDKYTDVKYAFAYESCHSYQVIKRAHTDFCSDSETTPNGGLDISQSEPDQLPVFVAAAHKHVCNRPLIPFAC